MSLPPKLLFWLLGTLALSLLAIAQDNAGEVTATASVPLQAARILSGEGFERRAALWEGSLKADSAKSLPVYLYPENEYCFLLADSQQSESLNFALFDAAGELMEEGSFHEGQNALHFLHLRPPSAGRYYLRVTNGADGKPVRLALTYCYR